MNNLKNYFTKFFHCASITETDIYKKYIQSFGYDLEEHEAITEDGYYLSIWHITHPNNKINNNKKVILLQHGLADTAWCFFQLKENSLPFTLIQNEYDVWVSNMRGNSFSLKHKTLDSSDYKSDYWKFSLDEHVKYDLTTIINYIKEKTSATKISYIGHSQGTTVFFMKYMSEPNFIEENIDKFIALAAVPNLAHNDFTPIRLVDALYSFIKRILGSESIINITDKQREHIVKFTKKHPTLARIVFQSSADIEPSKKVDFNEIYNYLNYYPNGTSKQNFLQWSQIHMSKKLVYFENFNKKKLEYLEYDEKPLENWKVKTLIQRSDNDTFSSYGDVTDFYDKVKDKSIITVLDTKSYGHLDCLAAECAIEDIYTKIIKFLEN